MGKIHTSATFKENATKHIKEETATNPQGINEKNKNLQWDKVQDLIINTRIYL